MLRYWLQDRLERGALDGVLARRCAAVYARVADPVRAVELPPEVDVVGVAGPTLGGSSKTPMVAELARRLLAAGDRPAVVAHGYRARPKAARRVAPEDPVELVGDDALCLAQALRGSGVPVYVAPRRADAIARAARDASVIVVDALLQTRPTRLRTSVLVLDRGLDVARSSCPPAGDLRASLPDMLALADVVLLHRELETDDAITSLVDKFSGITTTWSDVIVGATSSDGRRATLDELRRARVGLVLGVARPMRVITALEALGIQPVVVDLFADHAAPRRSAGRAARTPDLWLTTPKCATRLPVTWRDAPVWTLDRRLQLGDAAVEHCRSRGVQRGDGRAG
jgi:tetraacyldisaccharide 4'-kinase